MKKDKTGSDSNRDSTDRHAWLRNPYIQPDPQVLKEIFDQDINEVENKFRENSREWLRRQNPENIKKEIAKLKEEGYKELSREEVLDRYVRSEYDLKVINNHLENGYKVLALGYEEPVVWYKISENNLK